MSTTGAAATSRRKRGEARTYDFRRPVRLAREHTHLLRVSMQTFARQSTTVLTTSLRAVCQVSLGTIEELSYDEFLTSLPETAVCAVVSLDPWLGKALITLDRHTILMMIDHQLGGMGAENQPDRPLTDIEQSLARQLLSRLIRELTYALEPVQRGIQPQLLALESDARFVQAAALTDPVVQAQLELSVGSRETTLTVCLPYAMLHPVLEQLSADSETAEKAQLRHTAAQQTQRRLSDVEVDVAVRFDPLQMASEKIGRLSVGDIVMFDHRTSAPLTVTSASTVFAKAIPGSAGRKLAVLIVSGR